MSSPSSTSNALTSRELLIRSAKLIFFLILLPAFLTTGNLIYTLQGHGILFVESPPQSLSHVTPPIGIYWSSTPLNDNGGSYYWRQEENSNRQKLFGLLPAWPSLSQLATSLLKSDATSNGVILEYLSRHNAYCFKSRSTDYTICPEESGGDHFSPPALAKWKVVEGKKTEDASHFLELKIQSYHNWFKPYYFQKEEKPFQQLMQRPSTCLLLALNIGLAFCYWNYRVNPNSVALMDGPILQQFQYWRAITGTLAHFEWWHLLFNMMSLHNLGEFLEEHYYGSIPFLLFNLALIPLTILIFLGGIQLVYLARVKLRSNNNANNNNTALPTRPSVNAVGYSGVLFAWMVVSSLEQTKSCPIPFMSNVCFDTWHVTKNTKFNIGPLIQLVIAQVILPRVSFGGHLAGIIAGFLLHWSLLPLELVQPSVLIPLLTLVQWTHRQFIPIHNSSSSGNVLGSSARNFLDEAGIDDDDNNAMDAKILPTPKNLCGPAGGAVIGMAHLLFTLLCTMTFLLVASIGMMSWGSSLVYAQAILLALLYCCYQSYIDHWDDEGEQDQWSPGASQKKQRMQSQWKGFIVSCVLVVVLEAMTLACWMLLGHAMFLQPWSGLGLLVARIGVHLIALSVACKHWEDTGGEQEEKGIFEYSLGFCVLGNAKVVGQNVIAAWKGCRRRRFPLSSSSSSVGTGRRSIGDKDRAKNMAAAAAERRAARAPQESDFV